MQTHDLTLGESEVRKRFVSWDRGEADREWACLTLLDTYAPGVGPCPLRRESDAGGAPIVVMTRLPGEPLGDAPLTAAQTASLGQAIRRTFDVPVAAALAAGLPERISGTSALATDVAKWLGGPCDLRRCQDPGLVRRGIDAAQTWLGRPSALPEPRLTCLGISDRKPANIVWDGRACRLVDFEDGGLSDPAFELADHIEHLAGRLGGVVDPAALVDAVAPSPGEHRRMTAYRPLWAAFWLAMLLPGNRGFDRNPPGTTEDQARHLLSLLG